MENISLSLKDCGSMLNYRILKNLQRLLEKLSSGTCSAKIGLTQSQEKKARLLSRIELEAMQDDSFPLSLYDIKLRRLDFQIKVICK